MVNISNALVLIIPVIVGGLLARLIVDYHAQVASLLGIQSADVGSSVVVFHVGANVLFALLYCLNVLAAGSGTFASFVNPLGTVMGYSIPLLIVSHIISVSGVYLDRQLLEEDMRWRPSRRYYLMAVPLPLLAILFGGEYLYNHHRNV